MVQGDVIRENYGTILRKTHSEVWTRVEDHDIKINIPLVIPKPLVPFDVCCDCEQNGGPDRLACTLIAFNQKSYNQMSQTLTRIERGKRDRGVQILGDAMSVAIGVATEPMVAGLSSDIMLLVGQMERQVVNDGKRNKIIYAIATQLNNLMNFTNFHIEEADELFGSQFGALFRHVNFSLEIHQNSTENTQNILEEQMKIDQKHSDIQMMLQYSHATETIMENLDMLETGNIPNSLIKDREIDGLVQNKARQIGKNSSIMIPMGRVREWRRAVTKQSHNGTHLFLDLRIQFSRMGAKFERFELMTFDIPIHAHKYEIEGVTRLKTEEEVILVNKRDKKYMIRTKQWTEQCREKWGRSLCYQDEVLERRERESCLWAIYNGDNKKIMRDCEIRVFPNERISTKQVQIGRGKHILISQGPIIKLNCGDSTEWEKQIPVFAIVEIPCECSLTSDTITINPNQEECTRTLKTIELTSGFNLPVAMAFKLPMRKWNALELRKTIIQFEIPELYQAQKHLTKVPLKLIEQGIKIQEFANKIKQERNEYVPLWDKIHRDWKSTSRNAIYAFVNFVIVVLTLILTLYNCYRIRMIVLALAMIIPNTAAKDLTRYCMGEVDISDLPDESVQPTRPTYYAEQFNWVNYLVGGVGTASVIGLVILAYYVVRHYSGYCKKKDQHSVMLRLKIQTDRKTNLVKLATLALAPVGNRSITCRGCHIWRYRRRVSKRES